MVLFRGDRAPRTYSSSGELELFKAGRIAVPTRSPTAGRHDRGISDSLQHQCPIYDGERLFLHVFPAWSLLIGLGFGTLWNRFRSAAVRSPFRIILAGFILVQGYGTVLLHPFGLSFYNGLVGGLSGAERLGLELTYWNDPVDQVLLDRLAREGQPGATAALVPTLYPEPGFVDDKPSSGEGRHHLAGRARRRARGVGRPVAANRVLATRDRRSGSSWRGSTRRHPLAARCLALGTLAFPTGKPHAGTPHRPTIKH